MRRILTINLVMIAILAVAASAGAQGMMGVIQHAEHSGPDTVAVAMLSPVSASDAWGRIAVADETTSSGVQRGAGVLVFGLDPERSYSAVVDGVVLASFVTDATGTAMVALADGQDGFDPVPADLPAAGDLVNALVVDDSGAAVLEGAFTVFTPGSGWDSSVYQETIPLLDVTGGFAHGMARVQRGADDSQEFETRAAGLEPGTQYQIVVDGVLAGVVTAGSVGYAELALQTPDDENPLPDTLQPVEDLRLVEWRLTDGTTVLSGSFSGNPDGGGEPGDGPGDGGSGGGIHSIHGVIVGFVDGGFQLQVGMAVVTVQVTDATEFEGFSSLGDLQLGDMVEVEGQLDGDVITADRIELMGGGGPGDGGSGGEFSSPGVITGLVEGGFQLQTWMNTYTVQATDSTEFEGFSSLSDLQVGDMVEVEGQLDGDVVTASRIQLMDGGGPGDGGSGGELSSPGVVAGLVDGGFLLQTWMNTYTVQATDSTEFDGFSSLSDLQVGDMVEVEGQLDGDVVTASRIQLMDGGGPGDDGSGGELSSPGVVAGLVDGGFLLQTWMNTYTVQATDSTEFDDFSSLSDLQVGDMVEVEGQLNGDVVTASRIQLMGDGGSGDGGSGGSGSGGSGSGSGGSCGSGSGGGGWMH